MGRRHQSGQTSFILIWPYFDKYVKTVTSLRNAPISVFLASVLRVRKLILSQIKIFCFRSKATERIFNLILKSCSINTIFRIIFEKVVVCSHGSPFQK